MGYFSTTCRWFVERRVEKKMKYNKLIRDRIPEIIVEKGQIPVTHIAEEKEYWEKLKDKLLEEVNEFIKDNNKEELSDILEVIDSICKFKGYDLEKIKKIQEKKKLKRGSFDKRIILDEVKE